MSPKPTIFIVVALTIFASTLQVHGVDELGIASTGVRPSMYMVYLIRETLRNGTQVQAIDYYFIRDVFADGSIDAEVRWGVVGYRTEFVRVHVKPIDPSDPELNTLSAIVNVHVPDGVYKIGRAVTVVQRHVFRHNGVSYDGIVSNETIRDILRPQLLLYQGIWYYDSKTGILLHSDYAYGPPTFSVGTIDLVASNAFETIRSDGRQFVGILWWVLASLLIASALFGTRLVAIRRGGPRTANNRTTRVQMLWK